MRVGVLGGGLLGCCTALALAERGIDVVLLDRNQSLLSRAAVANEGKIHLGYMYAGDRTFATARMMMEGALAFGPFMQRYAGISMETLRLSKPAQYAVHRDSQHSADDVGSYLREVQRLIVSAAKGRERAYFGFDLSKPLRDWTHQERKASFDPEAVVAVFETPEVSIDPDALAAALRACIAAHPRIETRLEHTVLRAERDTHRINVVSQHADGQATDSFDHVVNALWDGRLAIDATMGLNPGRPWLHRLKYGITFTLPQGLDLPPSITMVSGPFGEIVSYPDRHMYLTWYPECLLSMSTDITPPDWSTYPAEPLRSTIIKRSIAAFAEIVPGIDPLNHADLPDACVKGGVIVSDQR